MSFNALISGVFNDLVQMNRAGTKLEGIIRAGVGREPVAPVHLLPVGDECGLQLCRFVFFGAHSLRSGFVTEAGRQNVPLGDTMAMTGHRSIQTVMRYFQTGAVQQSQAANLLKKE